MARIAQLAALAAAAFGLASAADAQSTITTEIDHMNNQSLLWGPYKPNLYFGVRPRLPEGLWTGLMWGKIDLYDEVHSGKSGVALLTTMGKC